MCGGSFETLVINAPLPDEFGRELAVQAADNGMDSILLCPGPQADKLAAGLEKYGVFVLAKPLSRQQTAFALRLIQTGRQRLQKLTAQNRRLTKRLDEARIISQAKCALALCPGAERGTGSPADRKRSHGQPHLQPGSRTGDHAKAGGRRPFITAFFVLQQIINTPNRQRRLHECLRRILPRHCAGAFAFRGTFYAETSPASADSLRGLRTRSCTGAAQSLLRTAQKRAVLPRVCDEQPEAQQLLRV